MLEDDKREKLLTAILELVQDHWSKNSQPLLTSTLGVQLREKGFDYKDILEGGTLKEFLARHSDKVEIAQHPVHHAKVGVFPAGENYAFPSENDVSPAIEGEEVGVDLKKSRGAFYAFIREISRLNRDEIDSIHIPTRVIVRLLEGK